MQKYCLFKCHVFKSEQAQGRIVHELDFCKLFWRGKYNNMQFNSWIFLFVFLPVVLLVYFNLNKYSTAKITAYFLTISSLCFYAYASWAYVAYFIVCIVANYAIAQLLIKSRKKLVLILGLIFNLGTLGWLKYCNFFVSTLNSVFKTDFNLVELFVPLGISFFTFQFIAFIYDCYKGNVTELSFLEYITFSTFSPKLFKARLCVIRTLGNNTIFSDRIVLM